MDPMVGLTLSWWLFARHFDPVEEFLDEDRDVEWVGRLVMDDASTSVDIANDDIGAAELAR